ncbi:MAG: patatin-like phospholipase family protein [Nitrospinae bacterium]|nr:patatin-like phospholipase family protein [Nitrospinota bacterium]
MKKIALVMGGGVSLGTYIAGALTELLYALQHNTSDEKVVIDVIAGASAGSMTAAMVAKALLYDKSMVSKLREAWVERINWRSRNSWPGLQRSFPDSDDPVLSLLNDSVVRIIAKRMLTAPTIAQNDQGICGASLRRVDMAFTLANFHGVPYAVPYQNAPTAPEKGFLSTIFSDWVEFSVGPEAGEQGQNNEKLEEVWAKVRQAALASGAFPFAFEPKEVERRIQDFGSKWLQEKFKGKTMTRFHYSDGGTFNNEPLALAAKLARARDAEEPGGERLFLFIDPYLSKLSYVEDFTREELSLLAYGKRLVEMFISESSAKDFLRAHRYNTRLEWFEALLECFGTLLDHLGQRQMEEGEKVLAREVDEFLREKLEADTEDPPSQASVDEEREENLQRIEQTYWKTLNANQWDPSKQALMKVLILALELASGLRAKRQMKLYLLAPSGQKGPLAGDFLMNFGGFFSERYRVADFRHGRVDCRNEILNDYGEAFGLKGGLDPTFNYRYDKSLKDATFADLNDEEKNSFREWFNDAFDWAAGRATRSMNSFLRFGVWLIKGFIRKWAFNEVTKPKASPAQGTGGRELNSDGGEEA